MKDPTEIKMDMAFIRVLSVFLCLAVWLLCFASDNKDVGALFALVLVGVMTKMNQRYHVLKRHLFWSLKEY